MNGKITLQKKGQLGEEASPEDSPQSNYSSAWGDASDSDAEQQGLDLEELQESRPPTSIFEDNQAKVTEKGGKGTLWPNTCANTNARTGGARVCNEPLPVPLSGRVNETLDQREQRKYVHEAEHLCRGSLNR